MSFKIVSPGIAMTTTQSRPADSGAGPMSRMSACDPALVLKVAGKNELFHRLHASRSETRGDLRDPKRVVLPSQPVVLISGLPIKFLTRLQSFSATMSQTQNAYSPICETTLGPTTSPVSQALKRCKHAPKDTKTDSHKTHEQNQLELKDVEDTPADTTS